MSKSHYLLSRLFAAHHVALIFISIFSFINNVSAQVIGGDISYKYLAPGKYKVTLSLIYQCTGDAPADVQQVIVSENVGRKVNPPYSLKLISSEEKTPVNSAVCSDKNNCIRLASYASDINVFAVTGGTNISWTSCCIATPLTNVPPTTQTGFNLLAFIPGPEVAAENSMPVFNRNLPAISFCKDQQSIIDLQAMDPDGDSLVFELNTPFTIDELKLGRNTSYQANHPFIPELPSFPKIIYAKAFSDSSPLGINAIAIKNKNNGTIEVKPAVAGNFLLGYCVKEYRNKVLLSTHQRVNIISVFP